MDPSFDPASVRDGDNRAFEAVVRRFERPLFGYLGRFGLDPAMAQDLAQETFLRLWRARGRYDPGRGALSTWLFAIARRLALDVVTANAPLARGLADTVSTGATPEPADADDDRGLSELRDPAAGPLDALLAKETVARLQVAVRALSTPDRSVLALAGIDLLTLADIARIEGCSVAAVKVRLHRARRRLRHHLEMNDDD